MGSVCWVHVFAAASVVVVRRKENVPPAFRAAQGRSKKHFFRMYIRYFENI
jgi:hypothetical protein